MSLISEERTFLGYCFIIQLSIKDQGQNTPPIKSPQIDVIDGMSVCVSVVLSQSSEYLQEPCGQSQAATCVQVCPKIR